jgi:predicted CopG family antitoxin
MQKKLTISIDAKVYDGLHKVVGRRKISRFIESLVRPHVLSQELLDSYREMAAEETREAEAQNWTEATFRDIADETR